MLDEHAASLSQRVVFVNIGRDCFVVASLSASSLASLGTSPAMTLGEGLSTEHDQINFLRTENGESFSSGR